MPTREKQQKIHLVDKTGKAQPSKKLIFIGGQNPGTGEPCSLVDTYDMRGEDPCDVMRIPPLPGKRLDATLVAKEGELYVMGGFDGIKSCDTVYKFSPREMRWTELSRMSLARNGHSSCVLGDHIVIAGGVGNDMKRISSVEAYDVTKNKWLTLPELPHGALTDIACCGHKGELIVSGGIGSTNLPLNIVVSYDMANQRWRRLPDLKCRRSQHAMASVNGDLYVLGDVTNKTVEQLDLNTNKFVVVGELPVSKCGSSAIVNDDSIILAGGWTLNDPVITFNVRTHESSTTQIKRNCLSPHVALFKLEVLSLWIISRTKIQGILNDTNPKGGDTVESKIQQLPLPRIVREAISN